MRIVHHPLALRDVRDILRHVSEATGDVEAATRRRREIAELIASIVANPRFGTRLSGSLDGWLVRHGGRRRMLTIVFRPAEHRPAVLIALVVFGGQDWQGAMERRRDFGH